MTRRDDMLEALGIGPQWVRRDAPADGVPAEDAAPARQGENAIAVLAQLGFPIESSAVSATDAEIAEMDWATLQSAVSVCTRCALCQTRTKTVFGVGDSDPSWLFVGEGPGRNEDRQGEPFIGPAGKLLDNMLAALSLQRGRDVYIANVVKCRPIDADGKDRAPAAPEIAACRPYLERQIALLKPTLLVALGKTAALALVQRPPTTPLSALRGEVHRYADLPMVVTYHPAYLLRVPTDKRKTWEDLCLALDVHGAQPAADAAPI